MSCFFCGSTTQPLGPLSKSCCSAGSVHGWVNEQWKRAGLVTPFLNKAFPNLRREGRQGRVPKLYTFFEKRDESVEKKEVGCGKKRRGRTI
jgi:hypothetical protein